MSIYELIERNAKTRSVKAFCNREGRIEYRAENSVPVAQLWQPPKTVLATNHVYVSKRRKLEKFKSLNTSILLLYVVECDVCEQAIFLPMSCAAGSKQHTRRL